MAQQRTSFDLKVELPTQLPPPEAANYFQFAVSGPEIEFIVGFLDVNRLVNAGLASAAGSPQTLGVEVSHRFLLTYRGLQLLRKQLDEIVKAAPALSVTNPDKPSI